MILDWKRILIPYEQAVDELKVKFKSMRNGFKMADQYSPIEFVTGRVKEISSILEKAQKLDVPLEKLEEGIEDIAGIRIMCQLVEDIEKVVALIRSRDGEDLTIIHEKDYIKHIKESGYRSYHMIIKYRVHTAIGEREILAEIQIRTLAMNFWATIEHSLNYKFKTNMPKDIRERLKNAAEAAFLLDEEMSEIRDEIVDAQGMFRVRSSLIAETLTKIQKIYYTGNADEIKGIEKEFLILKDKGRHQELEAFSERLSDLL